MTSEWVLCLILAACGPTNRPGDTPSPAEAPRAAPAPASVTLPPDVASIMEPHSLAAHRQRAWIARYGPIRFAPTEPIAEETADLNVRADDVGEPEVVVHVTAERARIVTGMQGLRILIWVAFDDLISVPIRTVALRASATAPEPPDNASAVRVYPGFRFTSVDRRGDAFGVHYEGPLAQFHGSCRNVRSAWSSSRARPTYHLPKPRAALDRTPRSSIVQTARRSPRCEEPIRPTSSTT